MSVSQILNQKADEISNSEESLVILLSKYYVQIRTRTKGMVKNITELNNRMSSIIGPLYKGYITQPIWCSQAQHNSKHKFRDQFKAFSLPPNENPEDYNGVEHLHHSDLKIVSSKQDLKVKVLTWKDSNKGFVKSYSSERISNSKITNN